MCKNGQTREVEESTGAFTIAVDSTVRFAFAGRDGPLDDLDDLISGTSIADMIANEIADVLALDSLGLGAESLTAQNARSWQSALDRLVGPAQPMIELLIAYDLEDVSLVCVRLEKCVEDVWVTVGHRVDELSRTRRSVKDTWEALVDQRQLGAVFTGIRRILDKAAQSKGEMDTFLSGCK